MTDGPAADSESATDAAGAPPEPARPRPWGPFLLLLVVGLGLLWASWRLEIGRIAGFTRGAGAALVLIVLAMAANRLRSSRRSRG
jgi:hypothetical protein